MNRTFGLFAVLVLVAANCISQELPVSIHVDQRPEGSVILSVTNLSPQPVTALVAVARRIPLDSSTRRGMSVRFFDAIESFVHDRPLLQGESTAFRFGGPNPGPSRVRYEADCKAGILADGTTFGDPMWAGTLVARRRYLYENLQWGIQILQSALESGLKRSDVMAQAERARAAKEITARDRFDRAAIWTVSDEMRHNLESGIRSDGSVVPDAERVQEVLELFLKRQQLLLNSEPSVVEAYP